MNIDRNSWHARWYVFSCRAWAYFACKDYFDPADCLRTDLCRYIRMVLLGLPTIIAANVIGWGTLVYLYVVFPIQHFGTLGLLKTALGVAFVCAVIGAMVGAFYLLIKGGVITVRGIKEAGQIVSQYAHDHAAGICRFITID